MHLAQITFTLIYTKPVNDTAKIHELKYQRETVMAQIVRKVLQSVQLAHSGQTSRS